MEKVSASGQRSARTGFVADQDVTTALKLQPAMKWSSEPVWRRGPPALSCDVEFGTGFLPPETDAPKGA